MTGYNEDYHDSTWPGGSSYEPETTGFIAKAQPSIEEVQRRITAEWNSEKEAFYLQINRWRDNDRTT